MSSTTAGDWSTTTIVAGHEVTSQRISAAELAAQDTDGSTAKRRRPERSVATRLIPGRPKRQRGQQAQPTRRRDRFESGMHVELVEQPPHVIADGVVREREPARNLGRRQPGRDQLEDLALAGSQSRLDGDGSRRRSVDRKRKDEHADDRAARAEREVLGADGPQLTGRVDKRGLEVARLAAFDGTAEERHDVLPGFRRNRFAEMAAEPPCLRVA